MADSHAGDHELIELVRSGDLTALGALYERHREAGLRVARAVTGDATRAEDIVSEAFERIHGAISRGGGPDESFRAYLYTVIRRLGAEQAAAGSRLELTEDFSPYEALTAVDDGTERSTEAAIVGSAFAALAPRHQAVLWYVDVEGMPTSEAAAFFGLSANATAALASRARSALRDAYLQAHVSGTGVAASCEPVRGKLGPYRAGSLSARDTAKVEAHLDSCEECGIVLAELADVSHGLRAVVAPLILGGAAAAALTLGSAAPPASAASVGAVGGVVLARGRRVTGRTLAVAATVAAALAVGGTALALATTSGESSTADTEAEVLAAVPSGGGAPSATTGDDAARATPGPVVTEPSDPDPGPAPRTVVPSSSPGPESPTPPPVVPPQLSAAFLDLGDLVLGRVGFVAVEVVSSGGATTAGSLTLTLPAGAAVDPDRAISVSGGIPWSCSGVLDTLACTAATVPGSATSVVSVPVLVGAAAPLGGTPTAVVSAASAAPTTATGGAGLVEEGLGTRFLADGGLDIVHAGASLLSCDPAVAGCLEARRREPGAALVNNSWDMTASDNAGLGVPSSQASLSIGEAQMIRFAGLYWSADAPGADIGAIIGAALLAAPGATAESITASHLEFLGSRYLAFADVTEAVQLGGAGIWSFGTAEVGTGAGASAGWSLVVVVEDDELPPSRAAVFDGLSLVNGSNSPSFSLPSRPGGEVVVGAVAWDGDAGYAGDQLLVDGEALTRVASGQADDVFASYADGAVPACAPEGSPECVAETNQLGFDTGVFAPITVDSDRVEVEVVSPSEAVYLGVVSLVTR